MNRYMIQTWFITAALLLQITIQLQKMWTISIALEIPLQISNTNSFIYSWKPITPNDFVQIYSVVGSQLIFAARWQTRAQQVLVRRSCLCRLAEVVETAAWWSAVWRLVTATGLACSSWVPWKPTDLETAARRHPLAEYHCWGLAISHPVAIRKFSPLILRCKARDLALSSCDSFALVQ